MTPDELERRMAEQPSPGPRRPAPMASAGSVARDLASGLRLVPGGASDGTTREQHSARREARRQEMRAQRAALAPRIHRALLAELERLDTCWGVLLGPTGTGKTSAARWVAVRYRGLWCAARELGACERRHPLGAGAPPLLERASTTRVLYVDDLGTEDPRDLGVIQAVIDERYARCQPTLATTGLTREQLASHLGAPYVRRLIEQHPRRSDGAEWPRLLVDLHGVRS